MTQYIHARPEVQILEKQRQFQLIDMQEDDTNFVLFGVTENGNSIQATILDYEHFFYIGTETDFTAEQLREQLQQQFSFHIRVEQVTNLRSIYALNRQPKCFFKITIKSSQQLSKMRNDLKNDFRQFNSDIDGKVRFLTDCGAVGCGWIQLDDYTPDKQESNCQICVQTQFKNVHGIEKIQNAPIRILSFDIECISNDGFPKATNQNDKIITIGVCTQEGFSGVQKHVVLQLNETAPLQTGHVACFSEEEHLIQNFVLLINKYDPDVITGYNIDNFDFPYVLHRAEQLKIAPLQFSRFKKFNCKIVEKVFQSNQLGTLESFELIAPGRVSIDALNQIKISFKLRSYTLNNVSAEFLNEQKDDVHYTSIKPLFEKDIYGRRVIAQYCLKDAILPIKLANKLMLILQIFEMAKVTGVLLNVLVKQGQQVRMVSLLTRYTKQHGYIIPYRASRQVTQQDDENEDLEGATVLEPKRGFYDKSQPISTLDFSSLYPSIIIAHNLCYSSLIDENTFDLDYFNFSHKKQFSLQELLQNKEYVTKTPQDFYFLKQVHQQGLLPLILQQLLQARKQAKRDMENAKDPVEAKVLNGRQLALKVTANSLYGFTGAIKTGKLPSPEISSSVTAFGRQMIELTRQKVEEFYKKGVEIQLKSETIILQQNAEVVYGDTDSVMVRFGVSFEQSFEIARHAAALVNQQFLRPISLEFEKVYCPYLLITKKRYAGLYWTCPEKYDKIDVKGLELVRRDNCQLVAMAMKGALNKLLLESDKNGAVLFIKAVVQDLVMERIDPQLLVISKALTQAVESYKAKNQPHIAVVLKKRQRGFVVKIGDRIQYLITRTGDKELYKRAEDPQFVIQKGLAIDTDYYLHQQLEKPIARLFQEIIGNGDENVASQKLFSGQHTLYSAPKTGKLPSVFSVKKTQQCLACGVLVENKFNLCDVCLKKGKFYSKYSKTVRELQLAEHRLCQIQYECCVCQDMEDATAQCSNADCDVYYARSKQIVELNRCRDRMEHFQRITWQK